MDVPLDVIVDEVIFQYINSSIIIERNSAVHFTFIHYYSNSKFSFSLSLFLYFLSIQMEPLFGSMCGCVVYVLHSQRWSIGVFIGGCSL